MKALRYIFWDSGMLPAILSYLCAFYFIWLILHPNAPDKDWLLLVTCLGFLINANLVRAGMKDR